MAVQILNTSYKEELDRTVVGTGNNITLGDKSPLTFYNQTFPYKGQSLLVDLVSYWKFEDFNDSHGSNHLTNSGAEIAAGKVNNGVTFPEDSFSSLSRVSNDTLVTGNIDLYIAGWVKLNSLSSGTAIISKGSTSSAQKEFAFYAFNSGVSFKWWVNASNSSVTVTSTFGALTVGTWYFVEAYHDFNNNKIGVAVNKGSFDTATASGGNRGTQQLVFARDATTAGVSDSKMTLDEFIYLKRLPTDDERALLYNNGNGITYPFIL